MYLCLFIYLFATLSTVVTTSTIASSVVAPSTSDNAQQTISTFVEDQTNSTQIIMAPGGINLRRFDGNESTLL